MPGEAVLRSIWRSVSIIFMLACLGGCSSWQPTKNVWKGTKGLWYTYVSPPASVDYEDKGDLPEAAKSLSQALMGIDMELGKLERTMQNADKPPTQDWLDSLFASYPWLSGFAGVKYDGQILGQQPPDSLKQLDFIPLLYEDKKQNSRALRCDVQPGPLGPEVMLAAPLYDGVDFLGIVVAYFDMRSLMRFSQNANDIVALTPGALLWPGRYQFAATPLAGVDWSKVVRESTAGTCSNSTGSFFYMVRYLGNLPLVFATPSKGTFPEGDGSLEQGAAYFPQEREKLPPPPMPERKRDSDKGIPAFEQPEPQEEAPAQPEQAQQQRPAEASDRNVIQQGSRDSMLLKRGSARPRRQVRERQLDGENIEVIRAPERRQQQRNEPGLQLLPESDEGPTLPGGRPSPFGPRQEEAPAYQRPSPFGPRQQGGTTEDATQPPAESGSAPAVQLPAATPAETARPAEAPAEAPAQVSRPAESQAETPAEVSKPAETPAQTPGEDSRPATLPGGRPSPFGPRGAN